MGSLAGHVLPGCLFVVFGVWWVFISLWTHLSRSRSVSSSRPKGAKGKLKRQSSGMSYLKYKRDHDLSRKSWLPQPFWSRVQLEPVIKIILPLIGVVIEAFFDEVTDGNGDTHIGWSVFRLYKDDGNFNNLAKLHHITMYSAFVLSGIVDLLSIFVRFPKHTSQIFFALAFFSEGILFYFHSEAEYPPSAQVHWVLTVGIFACGLVTFLRVFQATNLLINIGVASTILFQGTWFIQAGFLLFPPGKKGLDKGLANEERTGEAAHNFQMFVSACATWHVLGIAVFVLLMWVILHVVVHSGIRYSAGRRRVSWLREQPSNWMEREEQRSLITTEAVPPAPEEKGDNVEVEMQEMGETAT